MLVSAFLVLVPWFALYFGLRHRFDPKYRERCGRLQADERGLWLDGRRILSRRELHRGDVVRRDGIAYVHLRGGPPVEVVVDDVEEAAALLSALRLGFPHSIGRYMMSDGTYRSPWTMAGTLAAFGVPVLIGLRYVTENALLVLASLWAIGITVWLANPMVLVSVGADGVRLRNLLSRSRFLPFGAIEAAEIHGRNVTIRLKNGGIETMHDPGGSGRGHANEAQMLVDRINACAEDHRRDGADLVAL